jgi:trimethylamine:corrinoid methyltransferase-like protein
MTAEAPQQTRRGGTASRRAERASAPLIQERYITRDIPLYELINAEGVELLHEQSMTILEEIGIEFRDEPALKLWREAGADVKEQRVRIPRELLLEKLALTPRNTPSMPAIPSATSSSAVATRSSRRSMARPSCAASTTSGATARWKTCAISSSSPI